VPANNPARLATAIHRLLVDPQLRFKMGVRARERMLKHFSKERFVADFLGILQASQPQVLQSP
jgi:hypothetical protein